MLLLEGNMLILKLIKVLTHPLVHVLHISYMGQEIAARLIVLLPLAYCLVTLPDRGVPIVLKLIHLGGELRHLRGRLVLVSTDLVLLLTNLVPLVTVLDGSSQPWLSPPRVETPETAHV